MQYAAKACGPMLRKVDLRSELLAQLANAQRALRVNEALYTPVVGYPRSPYGGSTLTI
jgi:hypothetical protein